MNAQEVLKKLPTDVERLIEACNVKYFDPEAGGKLASIKAHVRGMIRNLEIINDAADKMIEQMSTFTE